MLCGIKVGTSLRKLKDTFRPPTVRSHPETRDLEVLDISTSFWNDRDTEMILAIILDDIDIRQVDYCLGPDGYSRG